MSSDDPLDQAIFLSQEGNDAVDDPLQAAIILAGKSGIAERRIPGTVASHLWGRFMRSVQMRESVAPAVSPGTQAIYNRYIIVYLLLIEIESCFYGHFDA